MQYLFSEPFIVKTHAPFLNYKKHQYESDVSFGSFLLLPVRNPLVSAVD